MLDGRKVFVGTTAFILFYQLLLPPVVGLADNGDFAKVTRRFNLYADLQQPYQFIHTTYEFHPELHWVGEFYSTEVLLTLPALALNSLLSKDGDFDLRLIGIVHSVLFLAALWWFAPLLAHLRRALRIGVYLAILLVFCDVMYVSGFNSFYMDEAAYLFLLLAAVFYLRFVRWRRRSDSTLLILCLLLMTTAKTQHALLGILAAALLFATRKVLWQPDQSRVPTIAALCLVAASLMMLWKGAPREYQALSVYNVTFSQILPHSRNTARALRQLGLDDSYRPLIGLNAYAPNSRMDDSAFRTDFGKKVSVGRLAWFYALHPRDVYAAVIASLNDAGGVRPFPGGNFDASTGYKPFAESKAFSAWSDAQEFLLFHRGARFLFAFLIVAAVLATLLWRRRNTLPPAVAPAGFTLIAMAFTELMIASLLDAMDTARHFLIFFAVFDLMLLATIWLAIPASDGLIVSGVRNAWLSLQSRHAERYLAWKRSLAATSYAIFPVIFCLALLTWYLVQNPSTPARMLPKPVLGTILTANPNPVMSDGHGMGQTSITWSTNATHVELRIGSPDGQLFARGGSTGTERTDNWVSNGMTFYLQNKDAQDPTSPSATLAAVSVTVR